MIDDQQRRAVAGRRSRRRCTLIRQLKMIRGDRCCFCGDQLGDDVTLDHVVPASHGGLLVLTNLSLAHHACNTERGTRNFFTYRRAIAARLGIAPTDEPQLYLPERTPFLVWRLWFSKEQIFLDLTPKCQHRQHGARGHRRRKRNAQRAVAIERETAKRSAL